jgi:hypothetical protein
MVDFPKGNGTGSAMLDAEHPNVYLWNRMPSALLTRLSSAAASSMSILAMPPGIPDTKYATEFHGPSLRCEEPNSKLLGMINDVIEAIRGRVQGNVGGDVIYAAFTPAIVAYANESANFTDYGAFVDDCVLGGSVCTFSPGDLTMYYANGTVHLGREDPLVLRLGETYYTCALRNTSYSVLFQSSTGKTDLELSSFKWLDMDPSYDMTYRAIGMAVASILTGTYYTVKSNSGGRLSTTMLDIAFARTSIGSTAMMGLVHQDLLQRFPGVRYMELPAADSALTRNLSLGQLVEELSRNVTLSMFSSTRLM